jgi:4-hydroxybutyryl-CoA dehydratase/vinylacetyl-CoA-Delta-isomerase
MPEPVFANIGKLLLATQIYDMHRWRTKCRAA